MIYTMVLLYIQYHTNTYIHILNKSLIILNKSILSQLYCNNIYITTKNIL